MVIGGYTWLNMVIGSYRGIIIGGYNIMWLCIG